MSTPFTAEDFERILAGDRILFGASDANLDQRICRAALRIAARVVDDPGVIETASIAWFERVHDNWDAGKFAGDENIATAIRRALTEDSSDG